MCFVTENKWPAITACSSESHQFVTQRQHIHYYPIFAGLPGFCRRCEFFESLSLWRSNSSNRSLSRSDNLLHMCHPVTSLGETCKGTSCEMTDPASCVCSAAQRVTVTSCMTWGHRGRKWTKSVWEGKKKSKCDSKFEQRSRCCARLNINLHYDMMKGSF